ncbi:hypothetical protein LC048_11675 [Mesobacillus subterraneus]|uniref:hypothetical protein n=1 Tax=Mesobacillus subterraneus TaxID=285983 RepID=UPI001CFD4F6D|nr:hypothetical protein [Mesobacillus subterraneus]WLR57449.1 hypothetical protein LC048_11675 [Mesobacillus subterraneus]
MVTYGTFLLLVEEAEKLNCKVIYDSKKKINFNPNMSITIPLSTTQENVYAFAHEIGHCIDFVNGELNYDEWLNDWSYRITAEMSAWVHAYKILKNLNVPLDGWKEHVDSKLSTYFKYHEVIA